MIESDSAEVGGRRLITGFMMAAAIMQAIDSTVTNVALPHMQSALSATQDEMGWVLTSYIVAAAIMMPMSGWLANKYGRRKILIGSIVAFTVASALCGVATSLQQIVLFRFFQGMAGAALAPLSQATLLDIYEKKDFARAMSIWGIGMMAGPVVGPALGGWLTENFNWRWIFYVNLPIGLVASTGLLLYMPESRHERYLKFDLLGFLFLSVSIGAFQLLLDRGQLLDWFTSSEIIAEAVIAALSFYLFIVHILSADKPFLSTRLFLDRNFVVSSGLAAIFAAVQFSTLALHPPLLQDKLHYPVAYSGLVITSRGFGFISGMFLAGRLKNRFDPRLLATLALGVAGYAMWMMTQYSLLMDAGLVFTAGIIQGVGLGFVMVSLSTTAFLTLPQAFRNEGTALYSLARGIVGSAGISVMIFWVTRNTQQMHATLTEYITPYIGRLRLGAIPGADIHSQRGIALLDRFITDQAALIAYIADFRAMMVMTILSMPFLWLLKINVATQK